MHPNEIWIAKELTALCINYMYIHEIYAQCSSIIHCFYSCEDHGIQIYRMFQNDFRNSSYEHRDENNVVYKNVLNIIILLRPLIMTPLNKV